MGMSRRFTGKGGQETRASEYFGLTVPGQPGRSDAFPPQAAGEGRALGISPALLTQINAA